LKIGKTMTRTITRVYADYAAADLAIRELKKAGLKDSDISILASNAEGWHRAPKSGHKASNVDPKHDKDLDGRDDRAEGAATGGGLGALAGGAAGAAVGLGLIAIPGVGPVVAFGWLAALAAGAVTVGAAGGIIGALVASGESKENAEIYAEALRRGGAIVTVRVPDDQEGPYLVIMDNSAMRPSNLEASYRRDGWEGYDANAPHYTSEEAQRQREQYRR
jgi:hypothetical protein